MGQRQIREIFRAILTFNQQNGVSYRHGMQFIYEEGAMASRVDQKNQVGEQTALLKVFAGTTQHYWGNWGSIFSGVGDPRNPWQITYPLDSLLFTGAFLFICQLGSRRGIKDRLRGNYSSQAKFKAWFGTENIPHGDTLNYSFQRLVVEEVQEVICRNVEILIRKKVLYRYRLLDVYYLIAIDGTGVLTFRERHCPHCLTKTFKSGKTIYYHPVLEAKLVTSNGFAFSLMTEFIENTDLSADKQDCELKAFYRLATRLKKRFPRLPLCFLLDGLYAGGPTFQVCNNYDWKYLIVLREDDLPNLHRSFAVAIAQLPNQRKQVELNEVNFQQRTEQVKQEYRWAEDLLYTDSQDHTHRLGLIECQESRIDTQGQSQAIHYKWVTNFSLTAHNVDRLANRGVRLRWKIENEGFNVQKNSDLNLEHPYSQDPIARKVFYLLLQLACIIFQLMRHGSLLLQAFPDGLRTAKNLAFRLLEAWRNLSLSPEEMLALPNGSYQIRFDTS